MANSIQLPDNPAIAQKVLENQKEKEIRNAEIGVLGKLWGISSSVPNNIAGLTILILLVVGCYLTLVVNDSSFIKDMWTIFSPIITLALGYLFGDKKREQ